MRSSPYTFLALAAATMTTIGFGSGHAPTTDPNDEPPLELVLHLDGAAIDAKLGRPFSVRIDGKQVEMKLTAKPTRHYSFGDVEFDYPKHMAYEVDRSDPIVTIRSLDGNDSIITVHEFGKFDAETLLDSVVDATAKQLHGLEISKGNTSLELGGKELAGRRLGFAISDLAFQQDFVAFASADATFIVMIQDTLEDDGRPTAECREVRSKLAKTFRFPQ